MNVALGLGRGGAALELELAAVHHAAQRREGHGADVLAPVLDTGNEVRQEGAHRALVPDAARYTLRNLQVNGADARENNLQLAPRSPTQNNNLIARTQAAHQLRIDP